MIRTIKAIGRNVLLFRRASSALSYAERRGLPGVELARFGREIGRSLFLRGDIRQGMQYLLTPVSIVRYFEFAFAADCLPSGPLGPCADASSPRLFSLYVAERKQPRSVLVLNPDPADLADTQRIARVLRTGRITARDGPIEAFRDCPGEFQVIWSLSVLEHITGPSSDSEAMRVLWSAVRPGGRLIITVPVDRAHTEEFIDFDPYGTQGEPNAEGKYFYQRFYDPSSLRKRLIAPLGFEPASCRWFGEKEAGGFRRYEAEWFSGGRAVTVEDPRLIVDGFQEYASWEEMPGLGVCGLMFEKQLGDDVA